MNRSERQRSSTTLILSGVLALIFGLIAIVWPGLTLTVLVILWGIYALVDGILYLIAAFRDGAEGSMKWLLIFGGAIGIIAGILALLNSVIAVGVLTFVLGLWLVVRGILNIVAAFRSNPDASRWLLVLSGVLWVVAGGILISNPFESARVLAIWLGVLAIAWGIVLLVGGIMMRNRAKAAAAA